MSAQNSLWIFQSIYAFGLALWLTIAVVDNFRAFNEIAKAVGLTMSMSRLRQVPIVGSILLERAVESEFLNRSVTLLLLLSKLLASLTCWIGLYKLVMDGGLESALPWLNTSLSLFSILLFSMHLAGLWFAYWIREGELQLTHLALLILLLHTFFLFNGEWV